MGTFVQPKFESDENVSEKHRERRISRTRTTGREISRGIALNPIAVLNNRIKPGPRIASKQTLYVGCSKRVGHTGQRREGDAGIGNLVSPTPPGTPFPGTHLVYVARLGRGHVARIATTYPLSPS